MKRKGWIVWTWGKLGSLIVFMGVMIMLLSAQSFVGSAMQADKANKLAQDLRDNILDTYNSVGGMTFEYVLPESLGGQDYIIEVLDKSENLVGIIVRSKNGVSDVSGGASFSVPLSESSFGIIEKLHYICIIKFEGKVYLERSRCA
jgi:hypothetical protein